MAAVHTAAKKMPPYSPPARLNPFAGRAGMDKERKTSNKGTNFIIDSLGRKRVLRPNVTLDTLVDRLMALQKADNSGGAVDYCIAAKPVGSAIDNMYVMHLMMGLLTAKPLLASPTVVVGIVMYTTADGDTACKAHCWLEVPIGTLSHTVAGGVGRSSRNKEVEVEVLDPSWWPATTSNSATAGSEESRIYFSSFSRWIAFMLRHPTPLDPDFRKDVLQQLVELEEWVRVSQRRTQTGESTPYANRLIDEMIKELCLL